MPVQLAASTGQIQWAARTRGGSGRAIAILARVYIPPSASTGTLSIQIQDSAGGGIHALSVGSSGGLAVQAANTTASDRTTDYTTTYTEGRWLWMGAFIPANFIGGGAVDASLFVDTNGTWGAATVSASDPDPGGTIGDTSGTVTISNGLNAAAVVGPVYVWAGPNSPDTAAEFESVAKGTATPESFTDLMFAATLRDDTTDTFGVDVTASTTTGATFVTQNGLPSWAGVRHHALVDIDPSRENVVSSLSTIANRALTGGDWTTPAAMGSPPIVTNPYGARVAYLGEDPGVNTNRAWEAPANGPLVHNQYCTIVYVFGAISGPGGTAGNLLATGATDLQLQLLGLGRFGFNSNITDATHRATATPSVFAAKLSSSPVVHWHGTFGKVTHASFTAGATTRTSGTMRLGAPTGSTTTVARIWLGRAIVFEGHLSDTEVDEVIASLGAHHRCRHYRARVSNLLAFEGQSSLAGTWDSRDKMGFAHRIGGNASPNTIVFTSATGGQTFSNHNADRDSTVSYYAATLCPNAIRKTFIGQMGSNDLDVAVPSGSTLLTSLDSYLNGNASGSGTTGNAISTLYDKIGLLQVAPRQASTATQADFATQVAVYNAGLASTANVDKVSSSYFQNYGAGGDWSSNPTYYHENPNGVHLNSAGHDLYWTVGGVKAAFASILGSAGNAVKNLILGIAR